MGPRASLDAVVKRKIPSPCWNSNPQSSSPQPSAIYLRYLSSLYRLRLNIYSLHISINLPMASGRVFLESVPTYLFCVLMS